MIEPSSPGGISSTTGPAFAVLKRSVFTAGMSQTTASNARRCTVRSASSEALNRSTRDLTSMVMRRDDLTSEHSLRDAYQKSQEHETCRPHTWSLLRGSAVGHGHLVVVASSHGP